MTDGAAIVFCAHTTCALLINEWEDGALHRLPGASDEHGAARGRLLRARRLRDPDPEHARGRAEERPRAREVDAPVGNVARDPGRGGRARASAGGSGSSSSRWTSRRSDRSRSRCSVTDAAETLAGMAPRRPTRQIHVGSVAVGGDAQISVQSMTTTKTAEIDATLQQIATLVAAGVDIVRVAVPHKEDAQALRGDRREVHRAGRRRHPFPVEVRDGGARGRHPGLAHQPGQHQVPGQGPTDRPRGERARRADPDRGQCGIAREGPAGALRLADPRGARRIRAATRPGSSRTRTSPTSRSA